MFPKLFLILLVFESVICQKKTFNVAVLCDDRCDESEDTIRYATELINSATDVEIKINLLFNKISPNQPLEAKRKTCEFLKSRIVGIIGTKSPDNTHIVDSICDSKDVPFFLTQWINTWSTSVINFHPRPEQLTDAYVDILSGLEWKELTLLYTSFEGLINMGEFIEKTQKKGIDMYTEQLNNLENVTDFRITLRNIKNSGQKNFVLVSNVNELGDILDKIRDSGLLTDEYNYFITNFNANIEILQPFIHSEAKIIGVQLIDPASPDVIDVINTVHKLHSTLNWYLTSEEALMFDALNILAATLNNLRSITPVSLSCQKQDNWKDGLKLIDEITSESYSGLTGTIEFDGNGFRKECQLHIFEYAFKEKKLGTWNTSNGLIMLPLEVPVDSLEDTTLENKHLIVEMILREPFLKIDVNGVYEGYAVDLIHELSVLAGFNYTIKIRYDGLNGGYDIYSNKWTGMIGDVVDGTADLAISDLTITSERLIAVDFTQPFMVVGIGILFQKPHAAPPDLFSFSSPFAVDLWRAIGLSFIVVVLSLFVIGRLCSSEWQSICTEHPEHLDNQLTFTNCLLFTAGGLFRQNPQIKLKSNPARIVAGFWGFTCFFFIAIYIANLICYQYSETFNPLFTDVESLVRNADKYGITYGAFADGSTEQFFKHSQNSLLHKIYQRWDQHPEDMAKSTEELIQRCNNGLYAAFMESSVIEYAVNRHYNLQWYGGLLDSKGYGIAMRKSSPYLVQMDRSIIQLSISGKLVELKEKWWKTEINEESLFEEVIYPLDLSQISGVIMVTIAGIILATFIAILQFYQHVSKLRRTTKRSLREIVRSELKKLNKRKIKCSIDVASPARNETNDNNETSEL